MTATDQPTVHPRYAPGPIRLQPHSHAGHHVRGRVPDVFEPTAPYLVSLPGLGVCRLGQVSIGDYRTPEDRDRVRVGYSLHPQTKALRDHGGRRSVWQEFYLGGARRMGFEPFENQLEGAVRLVLAHRDAAAEAAAARAAAARALREDLTARAGALGVTVEWADDAHPVLTAALLGVILTAAEEASGDA